MASSTQTTVGLTQADYALDDTNVIDNDIDSLKSKFIAPIDRYRSHSNPICQGPMQQAGLTSSQAPQESRTHTFYRLLGLPSITQDGYAFSPGFNPLLSAEDINRRQDLNSKISTSFKQIQDGREQNSRTNYSIFLNAGSDSSLFGLCLSVPGSQRSFSIVPAASKKEIQSLKTLNFQAQTQNIQCRASYITSMFQYAGGNPIPKSDIFVSVNHSLAPFITDPVIDANLDPKSGDLSVMIAAPFLEQTDIEYESNKYLKRCGLEMILRQRLREQNVAVQAQVSIDTQAFTSNISIDSKKAIAAAISDIGVDTVDVKRVLNGADQIELYILNDLVMAFKKLINLYVQAVENIAHIFDKIIWVPLCNSTGPESGTVVSTLFITPKIFLDSWDIERKIRQLQVKASLATTQYPLGNTFDGTPIDYGNFTIPAFNNVRKTMDDSLTQTNNQRNKLEADASESLKTIEIISGEVSGLGLIDVIAIYMALWSLDIPTLLSLIDDAAAARLNNTPDLKNGATQARASASGNATNAYASFAERVQTILSYADRLFLLGLGMPQETDGGDIPRDQG